MTSFSFIIKKFFRALPDIILYLSLLACSPVVVIFLIGAMKEGFRNLSVGAPLLCLFCLTITLIINIIKDHHQLSRIISQKSNTRLIIYRILSLVVSVIALIFMNLFLNSVISSFKGSGYSGGAVVALLIVPTFVYFVASIILIRKNLKFRRQIGMDRLKQK